MSADSGYTGPDRRARRPTPSEREHELALAMAAKTPPREQRAHFAVRQVKGVGGATVIEWEVDVPVCDEFPTAGEAFRAARNFAEGFDQKYKKPDTLEADLADLRASVKAIKK